MAYADWRGVGQVTRALRVNVYREAKSRGVTVESVIQEWGLRRAP
jgi:hypothetical protein